jgi:hypothetical protein
MHALWRDIRHATRGLRKTPGFLTVVILTLGLGIGANTAIFSLMDQVLLRPLPVHDPSALVLLDGPGAFRGRTMNGQSIQFWRSEASERCGRDVVFFMTSIPSRPRDPLTPLCS